VGPGRVNFSVGSNTCVGATLAFQQTCDVTLGFRSRRWRSGSARAIAERCRWWATRRMRRRWHCWRARGSWCFC